MLAVSFDNECVSTVKNSDSMSNSISALLEPRAFKTCLPGSCLFAYLLKTHFTKNLPFCKHFYFRINLQLRPQAMEYSSRLATAIK